MSSPNHDDLAHLKIPLQDILSATNNFSDQYICGKDAFETYYKVQLLWSGELINVFAGRLNKERFDGDQQFWMEVSMLSSLKHKNLASFVGFCDENDEKVSIYKRETRETLNWHLSDPMRLTWVRRLEIAVGIAQALSYIHYDESRDFSIIHRKIKSSLIYLNDDWVPKLGDFICSMKIKASERHNSFYTDKVWSTDGYTDPTYIETKSVNHKSDMYSFGIVMFELLCGRTSVIANDYNKYLAPVAITHYREKKLYEIIDWGLSKQIDSQSLNVFAEIAYDCLKEERSQRPVIDEIVPRLVKALELARENMPIMPSPKDEFAHLKIPLESILSATNNFDDENIIASRSFKEYKGQLLWSGELINIIARRCNKERNEAEQEFWTEISMFTSLKHKNLVSIVGFCDEKDEKVIITKYDETRGLLDEYLSDPMRLTWVQRLKISVGLAHALSYIHYDEPRDFSVIHRLISSSRVLLNDDWEPKLSDFECSMKIEVSQRHHSFHTSELEYVIGCGDPTYIKTNSVNHKSDMYSFGIVLFELLCGRKSIIDSDCNKYLAPVAITHYREKKLYEIIDWGLSKQIDSQSLNVFAEIAYDCLKEERSQRPVIDEIVPRLVKALELARENMPIMPSPKDEFAHLKIPLESILSATNNFDDENIIASRSFKEYKGQLLWSGELINIIARRCNKERNEAEQEFWTEISMFTSLKHKNLVSIVGFCDEKDEKVIITKYDETRGLLDEYLSDPMRLTWVQRLKISVGLAHALSYIHYDEPRDFSVIHRLISSSRVLLNDDWEPKLSDFECSMNIEVSQRHHSFHTSELEYVIGCGDPTYIKTNSVNHKSDMYSFGIVLFELLCGRKSIIDSDCNKYLAPVAITHYREKKLYEIIDWGLSKQIDSQSLNVFAEIAYDCLKEERSQRPVIDEIVPRLVKALELARENMPIMPSPKDEFAHLKIHLESILSATNNFDEENIFITGVFGKSYKGQLLWSGELINIIARRFNKERNEAEQEFWTEISMLTSLKHKNLVSIVGFCDEKDEKVIITKYAESRGGLFQYLSDPMRLTWVQRLKISVGLANALSYIHYDERRDFSVIHRNIDSYTVQLNDDWEPKLSDFECSMKIEVSQRHHSFHTNKLRYVNGHGDPTYIKTNSVNHKSDMYSFGIVLFELLCGRKSIIDSDYNKYLAPVAITNYREKKLYEIIDWCLWRQIDSQSLNIFAEIAYDCLNEERSKRPVIDEIVPKLVKALELARENMPIISSPKDEFAHLRIPLENILSTTNNFADENLKTTGGIGQSYKGQLSWSGELIDIIAQRLNKDLQDAEQLFWMEISMLSSLKHKNLVSLFGFCDENDEKVIITRDDTRGLLSVYLSDPMSLTWVRRLEISVGVAHALSFIHYDESRNFSVIHRYLCSATVRLNDDWEPKLSDFEYSMKIEASQRHNSFYTNALRYIDGYGDPTYIETKSVSHKSDMYSFGIVLFELMCCRESIIDNEDGDHLAPVAITHYREKKLYEIIDWGLSKQIDSQSLNVFAEIAYDCLKEERSQRPVIDEIVPRLVKALELARENMPIISSPIDEFAHLRIPLENILSTTNNFADENLKTTGGIGHSYKGQLSWSGELIDIIAQRLNKDLQDAEQLFWMEISMLSSLKHKNLVSLFGFCDENDEKVIITRDDTRGILSGYLSDPMLLTWVRRLEISVGVAHALSYIHYDESRDFSVIHRYLCSASVRLNDDWEPKLSDFEYSMKIEVSQRHNSFYTNALHYIDGYGDPTYIETKSVSHKSDIYSFGIVLFELLCGRDSILAPMAITHYREKKLHEIIDWGLWQHMDSQSLNVFAEIAYDCLKEERSQRPDIDEIVPRLVKALELARENMPIISSPKDEFAHLRIPLENILSTTNNFADENLKTTGGIGHSYKGQLSWSGELIDIIAQRLNKDLQDAEELFWMEISMLSSLKHKNLVSLFGFCDENDEKVIITRDDTRGILCVYLSDPMSLTWVRRLEISVGVAHALSYIHYDESRDFSVIHRYLCSANVRLNDDWEPKLSDFEYSMKIEASQRHNSFYTNALDYIDGYGDPTYLETSSVNHKSDMYSFGIVMFELLCGRKSVIADDYDKYLAPVAITHYREKKLYEIIDWGLWRQIDSQSLNIFAEIAYDCLNEERSKRPVIDEIVPRLVKALELARENMPIMSSPIDEFAHLRIPLENILSTTNNFADENLKTTGGIGHSYKGQLSWSGELIDIIAQRLNKDLQDAEQLFWMEISMLSSLKHKNLVSLFGFCDENDEKVIITRDDTRGILSGYLSDPMLLTWVRRLEISVGVAHALSYIHYDESRDFSVIHRYLCSASVRLNDDWEPKLSDFEYSMKIEASQRHNSFYTNALHYIDGYGDPTYIETKSVSHKSDIYSFGIVLFELLCGRKSVIADDYDKYLAPVAITHYREKKLYEIIDWGLWRQIDSQSLNIFAEIAYDCLNEERSKRPVIDEIVPRLVKALELARENMPIKDEFAHLKIPLESILSATNNFDGKNFFRTSRFCKEYKGQLLWSGELINIIARRFKKERNEAEQEFWTEISMLTSLNHKNVVSIVGFCDEKDEKVIITKYDETRGMLIKYLSDPMRLTWVQRLKISVGLAHALSYIHYDERRDFSVIHRQISSRRVLLNDDWEPKLRDFECSMKIEVSQRHHSFHTNKLECVIGYGDPTYIKTNSVNHKSDMYSFGIILFELLCGRKSVIDGEDNKYLAPLAIFHYREKILDDIIDPDLLKQMDPEALNIFAKTAHDCLNEERSRRRDIGQVVTRLEEALKLQLEREDAEHSSVVGEVGGTSSSHEEGSVTKTIVSTSVESHVSKKKMSSLKDLSHLKLSFEDIESATKSFSKKSIIRTFSFGKVYKGRLFLSEHFIDIIAKRYYTACVKDESKKIWTEISMLSSLEHKNLVSLIGFSDTATNKIIVYKKEANESLEKYLSDENLTWMQRLKICVGVANVLSYIHYDAGRDFSVIHCNIRSSKILLDDKWEPKLSGFKFSLKNTVARRHRLLLTRDIVKNAYLDPKYRTTGGVTHKSDVYSFGVVLFEVLCGRRAVIPDEELGEGLLSQLKKSHLEEMINPHLREQMDREAFKIFSETTHFCIQEERAKRPHIDQVVKRLEKAMEYQRRHENPVDRTSFNRLKGKNLEHLKIRLNDIIQATNNFDEAYYIGSGGFGKVYKADLEHFDSSNYSSKEGVDKCDLPKKRSTVAIKRIHNQGGEQGFIAEIEILTSCKHENIISLLGFCDEDRDHMILVYELASKGSLEDYMGNSDKMTNLTWMQRLKICLGIAHGLNYIHTNTDQEKQKIIHRDMKSANILLDDNWKAKIADFGLSKFHPADQDASTFNASTIAGTPMYFDPEYQKSGKLNKKSDIYSFGVVLFEILTGRLAYDFEKGIAPIARHHFEKRTLMEIVDRKIKEETNEHVFSLSKGPDKESLDIFSEIAFRCLAETQAQRPTIDVVINELKRALKCQENHKDSLKLSLEDIKLATQDFSEDNIIGHGDFGNVYRGVSAHGDNIIAAKLLDRKSAEGEAEFMTELEILMEYKHENVIGLVGYCDEEDEKIIVYDYASRGSLDKYLSDDSLTWVMRLKICIDIAIGLEFLHGIVSSPEIVIHRDISSSNILLFDDWKAKISDFGLSLVCPTNQDVGFVIDNVTGTIGYHDPLHSKTGFLTKESDIFSLGAVLFDILCGKLSSEKLDDEYLYLPFLAKHHYHVGKLDKLVFEGIKEQIVPLSYTTFTRIALQCLHHRRERRPTANEVIIQLKKTLEFQEDYEKWEPKLPKDYKEIIQKSKCPEVYSTIKKEDLYNIFSKGILLQQDKVLMSFDGIGERNAMVSATLFSYKNSCPHEWKSLPESRFESVAEMLDISKLNIEIKTNAQLLSPNVVYGVYLVFKLSDSRKFSSKPMCVNLKYKKGLETLHAYFATWRDKDWMMIELYQFLNQREDVVFEFLLESFSSHYCGEGTVYVEGIEFRAVDNVKHEEIGKLKEVQHVLKSNFNADQVQQLPTNFEEIFKICRSYDELFWLGEVDKKKLLVLSAKASLYKFSNVDLFSSKQLAKSRFQEVIELLPQQVFHLNCTIKSQMLSQDTEYVCYLVFKLSEKCQGLHCPVKVLDVLHKDNNEAEFVYFITPSALNINDITRVPKQREDGWMEIQLWKFNSAHEFKDGSLSIDMKFTSHEGPLMSGLIICGLEFRPMFFGNSDDIQRQREKKRMLQDEAQNPHIQPKKDEKATEL